MSLWNILRITWKLTVCICSSSKTGWKRNLWFLRQSKDGGGPRGLDLLASQKPAKPRHNAGAVSLLLWCLAIADRDPAISGRGFLTLLYSAPLILHHRVKLRRDSINQLGTRPCQLQAIRRLKRPKDTDVRGRVRNIRNLVRLRQSSSGFLERSPKEHPPMQKIIQEWLCWDIHWGILDIMFIFQEFLHWKIYHG